MPILQTRKPAGSRSNRMLTQRVINNLGDFFSLEPSSKVHKKIYGPIRVNYNYDTFEVHIKGNLVLVIDKQNKDILVTSGGHFDKYGHPTASTRELINGIFDTLEAHSITDHVRVYVDNEGCKICVITEEDSYEHPLDAKHCNYRVYFK